MPDIVVMFFILGFIAGLARSSLEIPKAAYDVLSLLLMLTIGLKGGMALYGALTSQLLWQLMVVVAIGALIPLLLFPLLRHFIQLSTADSASIAAHYGSTSAGTFAVALAYVHSNQLVAGPEVTLYLVALELPAIIVALIIYRLNAPTKSSSGISGLLHESLTNRSVILLLGGIIIGFMYGPVGGAAVTDLFTGAFKGILAIFLLEMGLVASQTLTPFPWKYWRLAVFAVLTPIVLGIVGIATARVLGLSEGSAIILAALTASASYIAAPAAIKQNIPEADIGLAMLSALGITFPFNVLIGIGLYHTVFLAFQ
jgi:hypothetical protein